VIVVIGAGPAGLMAAIQAAKSGKEVVLIEQNGKIGKKLFITGKGRCNITNNVSPREFIENVVSNPKFLTSAIYSFPPSETIKFFLELGLPVKEERGMRVFPNSDKSSDVISAFNKAIERYNVQLKLNERFEHFVFDGDRVVEVRTSKATYLVTSVIFATGGMSYPATGSDGYGYKIAKRLGHTIIELKPALCPLIVSEVFNANNEGIPISILPLPEGLSLKNVSLTVAYASGKPIYEGFGEGLFTSNGMSGPLILTASSKVNREKINNLFITIDLKPTLTLEQLDARILRDFAGIKNKSFKNALDALLPRSLINLIIKLSLINPEKEVNSITKTERLILLRLLKGLKLKLQSLANVESAVVTAGGISTKEIDPKTMKSRIISNLYFAGEILDVDALTGGFNIQIAFSTGYVAGNAAE
jgi:predicted Rossmann fold flavoprotein